MPTPRNTRVHGTPSVPHAAVLALGSQGLGTATISQRLGISQRAAAHTLLRHRRGELDMPAPATMPPRRRAPVLDPATLDPPPSGGVPGAPGYDAWQLIHIQKRDVRSAAKALGLRYPSEVFDLLAEHKRHVQAEAQRRARAEFERLTAIEEQSARVASIRPSMAWVEAIFEKSVQRIATTDGRAGVPEPEGEDDE